MESIHVELPHKGGYVGVLEVLSAVSCERDDATAEDWIEDVRKHLGEVGRWRHDEALGTR